MNFLFIPLILTSRKELRRSLSNQNSSVINMLLVVLNLALSNEAFDCFVCALDCFLAWQFPLTSSCYIFVFHLSSIRTIMETEFVPVLIRIAKSTDNSVLFGKVNHYFLEFPFTFLQCVNCLCSISTEPSIHLYPSLQSSLYQHCFQLTNELSNVLKGQSSNFLALLIIQNARTSLCYTFLSYFQVWDLVA